MTNQVIIYNLNFLHCPKTHREPRLEPGVVLEVVCVPGELAEGDAVVLHGVVAVHRRPELVPRREEGLEVVRLRLGVGEQGQVAVADGPVKVECG